MSDELNELNQEQGIEQAQDEATQAAEQPSLQEQMMAAMFGDDADDTPTEDQDSDVEVDDEQQADDEAQAPQQEQDVPAKAQDVVDDLDEVPADLAPKSQERFRNMANELKERRAKEAELLEVQKGVDALRERVQTSFGTVEAFDQMADYGHAKMTGNHALMREMLLQELRDYFAQTGEALTGDLVSAYPDIKKRVENFEIDEDAAAQMARQQYQLDQHAKAQQQVLQQQQAMQQEQVRQQQFEQEKQQALQQIAQFAQQAQAQDLNWQRHQAALTEYANKHLGSVPPNQWPSMMQTYYQGLLAASARVQIQSGISGNGSGVPSSQVKKEPKNMMEAMFPGWD